MQSLENRHDYMSKEKASPQGAAVADKEERRKGGRRPGRKSQKVDMRAKLERSRQSARECRARKKIRYQYLDELVSDREKAVLQLREELEMYTQWARALDEGHIPEGAKLMLEAGKRKERECLTDRNRP